jgi:hypothetical protein
VSAADPVERRTPEDPVVLSDLASSLLDEASGNSGGNAATSLTPTDVKAFTQTVVAVPAGNQLDAEHWNGPATVQVITGAATITDDDGVVVELGSGQLARLQPGAGTVRADRDLVVLLTVAPA